MSHQFTHSRGVHLHRHMTDNVLALYVCVCVCVFLRYRTFGAVVVTPTAFFRLLACGECVLLYPGGVREGFKRRDEK